MAERPTRQELSRRLQAFDARRLPFLVAVVVLLPILFAANGPVLRWFPRHGLPRGLIVLLLATELGAMAALLWYVDRMARAAGLVCPDCAHPFTESRARQMALSVGRCASCNAPLASDAVDPADAQRQRSSAHHVDHAKRLALLAHLRTVSAAASGPPVVPSAQFFDGNGDNASIAANLVEHPGVGRFAALISKVEARRDVQAVLVEITDLMADDEDSWPYSDTVYVLTGASPATVREWFAELEPDEVDTGFSRGGPAPPGSPELAPAMAPVRVWWD